MVCEGIDLKFKVKLSKFWNPTWRIKIILKSLNLTKISTKAFVSLDENWYSEGFRIANFTSKIKIWKFKMADPQCRITMLKSFLISMKMIVPGFLYFWLRIQNHVRRWLILYCKAHDILRSKNQCRLQSCKLYSFFSPHLFVYFAFRIFDWKFEISENRFSPICIEIELFFIILVMRYHFTAEKGTVKREQYQFYEHIGHIWLTSVIHENLDMYPY